MIACESLRLHQVRDRISNVLVTSLLPPSIIIRRPRISLTFWPSIPVFPACQQAPQQVMIRQRLTKQPLEGSPLHPILSSTREEDIEILKSSFPTPGPVLQKSDSPHLLPHLISNLLKRPPGVGINLNDQKSPTSLAVPPPPPNLQLPGTQPAIRLRFHSHTFCTTSASSWHQRWLKDYLNLV